MFPRTLASRPPAWTNDSQTCRSLDTMSDGVYRAYECQGLCHGSLGASILIALGSPMLEDRAGNFAARSEHLLSGHFLCSTRLIYRTTTSRPRPRPRDGFDNVSVHFTHKLAGSTVHASRTGTSTRIRKVGHKYEHRNLPSAPALIFVRRVLTFGQVSTLIGDMAGQPTSRILDSLRSLERKTGLVFTFFKASVYAMVVCLPRRREVTWCR